MRTEEISVGDERFVYTNQEVALPKTAVEQLLLTLEKWSASQPYEPTFVMREYGIPSLIVRFDGVLDANGKFRAYEIQGGCGWIGYAGYANPAFREIRDMLAREKWPPFKLLMPPVETSDDELWLERITLEEALRTTGPLMIRNWLFYGMTASERSSLLQRAVKPIFDQNDKDYGVEFGWWKRIVWNAEDTELLPWEEAFVLKPVRGYGSADVMIWKPQDRKGRATRTQILEALKRKEMMYLQEFIPPHTMEINGRAYNMMLRPFFGYDPIEKKWVPMHGVWAARPHPNLRLHGASDTISGPLMIR